MRSRIRISPKLSLRWLASSRITRGALRGTWISIAVWHANWLRPVLSLIGRQCHHNADAAKLPNAIQDLTIYQPRLSPMWRKTSVLGSHWIKFCFTCSTAILTFTLPCSRAMDWLAPLPPKLKRRILRHDWDLHFSRGSSVKMDPWPTSAKSNSFTD